MLKLLDLFSGIGGFSLGLESTGGFETIAFVEKDDFCQKVLKKHWPNTTIEGDIRNVKGDKYEADIITGGFPCQPFSVAGKRKGTDDDRYLWDETIRVVRECKPKWFIGENVEGLININNGVVLRQVQTDLEKEGFEVQCLVIPASGIGAWHQRKRIWIIAHNISNSNSIGYRGGNFKRCSIQGWTFLPREQEGRKMGSKIEGRNEYVSNSESISSNDGKYGNDSKEKQIQLKAGRKDSNGDVSNSKTERLQRFNFMSSNRKKNGRNFTSENDETRETWWQTQSRICGVPNGVSFELDKGRNNRIKSLGNSIVPQIVRELGLAILAAEDCVNN
jgi:DNA (cytosine-5)-methyltransferase 1